MQLLCNCCFLLSVMSQSGYYQFLCSLYGKRLDRKKFPKRMCLSELLMLLKLMSESMGSAQDLAVKRRILDSK